MKPVFVDVQEQERIYHYPEGPKVSIAGVVGINVSKSGTHRINCANGAKVIVAPGWRAIEFYADDWSF